MAADGVTTTSGKIVECVNCGRKNRVPPAGTGIPRCGHCRAPLPWVADAGDENFGELVHEARIPVVVDLWAAWCAPCRRISPALEQLAGELAGRVKLVKVNIDHAPQLAERFSVKSVPTLLVMKEGRVVAEQPGAAPLHTLRMWVERAIGEQGDVDASDGG